MRISSDFDGGKITCVACAEPGDIRLEIPRDSNSDFYQWFYFRLTGARALDCTLTIVNAGGATYPSGWKDYRAVASYDRQDWFRVPTDFDGTVLTIRHAPASDSVYYAYFAPYSMERHADLIGETLTSSLVRLEVLGATLDGQDIDLLHIGAPTGTAGAAQKRHCWVLARQHPGETMAEWWMEGFLRRLLDGADPVARELLKRAVFHVVPNMNPDGSRRGNLRTNGAGANLNREWKDPALDRSPEVFLVRRKMADTAVDFCLDVHGDETIPHNFLIGTSGIPSLTEMQTTLHGRYAEALCRASPDFQTAHGYPQNRTGTANLTMCANYVAETFGCLALTLEMPFTDTADAPDQRAGWSPARCRKLGGANLDAILAVAETLR